VFDHSEPPANYNVFLHPDRHKSKEGFHHSKPPANLSMGLQPGRLRVENKDPLTENLLKMTACAYSLIGISVDNEYLYFKTQIYQREHISVCSRQLCSKRNK